MTGWMLGDDEQIDYTFPDGYKMAPGQLLKLFGSVNHTDNANVVGIVDILQSTVLAADTVGNGLATVESIEKAPGGEYDTYAAYGSKFIEVLQNYCNRKY